MVHYVKSVHYDSAAKYEHDAPFQDVLKSHKITFKSSWRSMQRYDPTLPKNLKGPRGQSITIEDYRCNSSRPNTIKYIIIVCPAFGVVLWEPVAGTSGRAYTPPPELQYQTLAGKDARFITKAEFVKYIGRMLGAFREKAARLAAKQTAAVKAAQKQGRQAASEALAAVPSGCCTLLGCITTVFQATTKEATVPMIVTTGPTSVAQASALEPNDGVDGSAFFFKKPRLQQMLTHAGRRCHPNTGAASTRCPNSCLRSEGAGQQTADRVKQAAIFGCS
eukprot:XP_001691341.1 predicted protein [Chlamydomonas reinhardtii]